MAFPETIPHVLEDAARRFAKAPALIENGAIWTYADLWSRSRATASAMIANGIRKGDRVAIWAPNSAAWIVIAVAAMAAGAAIVPLNTRLKGREAGDILRRTRSDTLFTLSEFLGADYPAMIASEHLPDLRRTIRIDSEYDRFVAEGVGAADPRVDAELAMLRPSDLSDIMFTSGTTGVPKGVLTTHDRIVPMYRHWVEVMGLARGERYLIVNPFFHSFGFKAGWVAALIAGAVIIPAARFDVGETIRHIEEDRINFLPGPPTLYMALLAARAERVFDTSSLRGAATGAASVPPALIRRMRSELGLVDTVTAYGMTECTTIAACRRGDDAELIATSVGKAVPGLEIRIVDEQGCEAPAGAEGEILVRGYGVMLGYLDDRQATAETIDTHGWLHTGDIGWMDAQGYLRITDRKKDMYISGGFNCYPAEIEKLLMQHPQIGSVAVIGVPEERLGEVGMAFVVPRTPGKLDLSDLAAWAAANMANYKVPRSFELVTELPLNAAGKVSKADLRAQRGW